MKKYIYLFNEENKKSIILFITLNIILVFAETFSIALIPLIIDFAINDNPLLPKYLILFESIFNNYEKSEILVLSAIFLIFIFILKNLFIVGLISYQAILYKRFSFELKKKFFSLYIKSPYEVINSYNSSQVLRNCQDETSEYVNNFFIILKTFKDLFLFLSIFTLLLFVDFFSTLIAVFILFILLVIYYFIFQKKLRQLGENSLISKNYYIKWILQSISSIKNIKISKKEDNVLEKYLDKVNVFEDARKKINIISALPNSLFEVLFVIVIFSLIIFIVEKEVENVLPILSLYVISFIRLLPIFSRFGQTISNLRSSYPSVLHLNSELNKLENLKIYNKENNLEDLRDIKFEKEITLQDIHFKYSKGNKNILEQFNLSIQKGKAIGLVGKSGSGKTTILNIFSGLLYPHKGSLLVDEKNVLTNINSWQKKIGLVPQENFILDDTILNNIIFLNNENSINKKNLEYALKYSGLSDLVSQLELGVNTVVGERGSFLSGGQVQRIVLARLLYNDPDVLILDEFTNSLDPENEDEIIKNLNDIKKNKNKNIIMTSHKIKPLKLCDEIIIIDDGKIVEKYDFEGFNKKFKNLYH